jgi:hypothetical protein
MYERSFGKLIASYDDDEPSTRSKSPSPTQNKPPPTQNKPPPSQNKPSKPQGNGSRKGSNGKSSSTSSDDELKKGPKAGGKKAVQFSEGSNAGSDYSSTPETGSGKMSARDKVSAREARSNRRQAKIDEDAPLGLGEAPGPEGKRRAPPPNHSKKRQRGDDNGEVVKVKLLTGTLFLYRGRHRRAEFIRRV